jgi:hypothetical protein
MSKLQSTGQACGLVASFPEEPLTPVAAAAAALRLWICAFVGFRF